jgi:pimeloyl-ACP methyl ester carboxylesterase
MTAALRHQVVTGDGVAIAAREWPTADAETVLLLHGYPDDQTVWDDVAKLLNHDYRVVSYDVRGSGASDAPLQMQDYSHQKLADDFAAVIRALAPSQKIHLVAHDWGSVQAWFFVNQPELVASIKSYCSISGPGLDYIGQVLRRRIKRPTPINLWLLVKQLLMSWYVFAFHLPFLGPYPRRMGLAGRWFKLVSRLEKLPPNPSEHRRKNSINGMQLYRANIFKSLFKPQPFQVNIPVLLIVPTQDRFLSPSSYDDLGDFVPQLTRKDIRCGHWLPLLEPALLADEVRQFINSGSHPERLARPTV